MPEFTVQNFKGGIINRVRPHLLEHTHCVNVTDADIVDGSLRPFKASENTQFSTEKLDRQNGAGTRSLVKWEGNWYWSDNDTGELDSDLGYMGVESPQGRADARVGNVGNRFVGVYQYLFTFETTEGFESGYQIPGETEYRVSVSTAIKTRTLVAEVDAPQFSTVHKKSDKLYGYNEGDYVRYGDITWRCKQSFDNGNTKKTESRWGTVQGRSRIVSVTIYDPDPLLLRQTPGEDDGKYWENVTSENIDVSGAQEIIIENIPKPASRSVIRWTNIYRTVADGQTFFFLDRIAGGSTGYLDSLDDSKISLNRTLDLNALNYSPIYVESDGQFSIVGGKYLTLEDGIFYLAYKDRVYLSKQDNPHGWDPRNFLTFEDEVTGIASEDRGVLVFTNNRTYHVTGTTATDITRRWVPNFQGCPNWRTISYLRDVPIWLSNDGLTIFGYERDLVVERLTVLTEQRYTFPDNISFATVANDIYYAFTEDSKVICVDFRRDQAIYERSLSAVKADYDADSDRLIIDDSGQRKIIDAGTDLEWTYISPEFNFDSASPKRVRSIWLHCTDDIDVTLTVDGDQKTKLTSKGSKDRRLFFKPGMVGDLFQLTLSSKGELKRFTIEWYEVQYGR